MSDASDDLGPFIACPSGVVVRMLAVNLETSTQDLGEQAINTSGRPTTHRARPAPPMRRQYEEDRWLGQKFYPVLIVEKDTLEPIASRWQMPFASSRGYSSLKLQHDVAQMLLACYARTKQVPIIYFVSDLDPSGLDLQRACEKALENFGVLHLTKRIGLTPQVQDPDLDRLAIEVKPSDSRAKTFVEQYGTAAGRPMCCQLR